jgi:hypothetical protein
MGINPRDKLPLTVVNLTSTIPPPPGLGPAGIKFWHDIMTEYDISDLGGQAVLEQCAFAYERAERLRAEIDAAGEIIVGRNGPREHPLLRAEMAARSFIVRALQRLGLNFEPVKPMPGRPPKRGW